jgi:nifR3 family TIM-barrel protein
MDHEVVIGNLRLANPFFLGPMAHYTNRPARALARRFGAALVYTEMIAAQHFVRCGPRYRTIADFGPDERPIAVQMAPATPQHAAQAARLFADLGFDLIDINMGCPAPKICRRGRGGALMCDPPRAVEVVESVVQATALPVTVKLRSGWSPDDGPLAMDLAPLLERAGACAICLHPRYVKQSYSGRANWLHIAEMAAVCRIPVIGSGDLATASDAMRMLRETRCAAVAFARGALGNPWVFAEAVALWEGRPPPPPPVPDEVRAVVREHCRLSVQLVGWPHEYHVMRRTLPDYLRLLPERRAMMRDLSATRTRDDWEAWKRTWGFDSAEP